MAGIPSVPSSFKIIESVRHPEEVWIRDAVSKANTMTIHQYELVVDTILCIKYVNPISTFILRKRAFLNTSGWERGPGHRWERGGERHWWERVGVGERERERARESEREREREEH